MPTFNPLSADESSELVIRNMEILQCDFVFTDDELISYEDLDNYIN